MTRHVLQLRTLLSWQTHLPVSQGTTPAALQWTASLAARGTVNNPFELLPPVPKCDQYIMTPVPECEPSALSGRVSTILTRAGYKEHSEGSVLHTDLMTRM